MYAMIPRITIPYRDRDSNIRIIFPFYLLTFFVLWTASVREESAVHGRKLLSGREGNGEIISLKVAFKGGS